MEAANSCGTPGSLRSRYANARRNELVGSPTGPTSSGSPASEDGAQDETRQTMRDQNFQEMQAESASLWREVEAVRARRQRIDDAAQATTSEIRAAKSEMHYAMDVLKAEKAALFEADQRGAKLLEHLRRFQDLQSELMKVLESDSCGSSPERGNAPQGGVSTAGSERTEAGTSESPVHEWDPMTAAEQESCRKAYAQALASCQELTSSAAQELAARGLAGLPVDLEHLVGLADLDSDGTLDEHEFALMLYLMKQCRLGASLPGQLSDLEFVHIFHGYGEQRAVAPRAAVPAPSSPAAPSPSASREGRRLLPPAALVLPEVCGLEQIHSAFSTDSDAESFLATPSPHHMRTPASQDLDAWEWAHSTQFSGDEDLAASSGSTEAAASTSASVPRSLSMPERQAEDMPLPPSSAVDGAEGDQAKTSWRRTSDSSAGIGPGKRNIRLAGSNGEAVSGPVSNAQAAGAMGSGGRRSDEVAESAAILQPVVPLCPECAFRHGDVSATVIRVFIEKVGLDSSRFLEDPFISVSIRGADGSVQVPEKHTPAAVNRANRYIILQHSVDLPLPPRESLKGSAVFFELRHWKVKSHKVSLKAWSVMPLEPLLQECSLLPSGFVARPGALNLPLYMKPLDPTRRKCRRIPSKTFDLHVRIS